MLDSDEVDSALLMAPDVITEVRVVASSADVVSWYNNGRVKHAELHCRQRWGLSRVAANWANKGLWAPRL